MSIEEINKMTGDILKEKEACDILEYKLSELKKEDSTVEALLTVEINRNKRSQSRYFLDKKHVIVILERELFRKRYQWAIMKKKYEATLTPHK